MEGSGQTRSQRLEIVELAVIDEDVRAELHRLCACDRHIEDGKPAMRKRHSRAEPVAFAVRPTVREPVRHGLRHFGRRPPPDDSGNTAHAASLPDPRYIRARSTA